MADSELSISDSEIDFVFNAYCKSKKIYNFGVKCALLHLYREEFSREEVTDLMYRASSRTIDGILLSEFRSLVKFYECSLDFQQRMVEKLFIAFDSKHRGYITKDDFQKLLIQVAPKLAKKHSDRFFSAVDKLNVGKIVLSKFSSTIRPNT